MRLMPFIQIQARGQYRWKASYRGDGLVPLGKQARRRTPKRSALDMAEDSDDEGCKELEQKMGRLARDSHSESENNSSVAQDIYSHVQVADEASAQEKDRAIRNLDQLLEFTDARLPVPRMETLDFHSQSAKLVGDEEVCGYKVK